MNWAAANRKPGVRRASTTTFAAGSRRRSKRKLQGMAFNGSCSFAGPRAAELAWSQPLQCAVRGGDRRRDCAPAHCSGLSDDRRHCWSRRRRRHARLARRKLCARPITAARARSRARCSDGPLEHGIKASEYPRGRGANYSCSISMTWFARYYAWAIT